MANLRIVKAALLVSLAINALLAVTIADMEQAREAWLARFRDNGSTWRDVSGRWEQAAIAASLEAVVAREETARIRDQFLVCNSMLPRAQRFQ